MASKTYHVIYHDNLRTLGVVAPCLLGRGTLSKENHNFIAFLECSRSFLFVWHVKLNETEYFDGENEYFHFVSGYHGGGPRTPVEYFFRRRKISGSFYFKFQQAEGTIIIIITWYKKL